MREFHQPGALSAKLSVISQAHHHLRLVARFRGGLPGCHAKRHTVPGFFRGAAEEWPWRNMENPQKMEVSMGKSSINGPFSIWLVVQ